MSKGLVNKLNKLIEDRNIFNKGQFKSQKELNEENLVLKKCIESELEDVTVEGTEFEITDAANYYAKMMLKGNTEQTQYIGKQLFKDEYIKIPNRNNKNAILSAGTYTLATCDGENFSKNIYISLFDLNGNLITESGHITSSNVTFNFSTTNYVYYAGANVSYITFTLDADYILNIGLLDANNTRQVVLVAGTNADRDYEPFVGRRR